MESKLFGNIQWEPPTWLGRIFAGFKRFWQQHRKIVNTCLIAIVGIIILGSGYLIWQHYKPTPNLAYVTLTTPDVVSVSQLNQNNAALPADMVVNFTAKPEENVYDWTNMKSVAPLQNIKSEVTQGVNIDPDIQGKWLWTSDSKLQFTPVKPWPAGVKYTISMGKSLLANEIKLPEYKYEFTTPTFQPVFTKAEFNINLKDPSKKNVVATIEFNYPVDQTTLQQHLRLHWQKGANANKPVAYALTMGPYQRRAYITSTDIKIQQQPQYVEFAITKGLRTTWGGKATQTTSYKSIQVPGLSSYLKIDSIKAGYSIDDAGNAKQILTIPTNIGITNAALQNNLQLYLLSETDSKTILDNDNLSSPGVVTNKMLKSANKLNFSIAATEHDYANVHNVLIKAPAKRVVYVNVSQGLAANGGFVLGQTYRQLVSIPELPQMLQFVHQGAIVALSSQQKIALLSRGVKAVKITVNRILPGQLNQLISQTTGDIKNPQFQDQYDFNEDNISAASTKVEAFKDVSANKPHEFALDLSKFAKQDKLGLYLVNIQGWDAAKKETTDIGVRRLFLVTNFGIYLKRNADNSQDVFVQSITNGEPVANAKVTLIGLNGLTLTSGITDAKGHLHVSVIDDATGPKQPLAFVINKGKDTSFIPFDRADRQLNFSRFSVGGTQTDYQKKQLSGYMFTDRDLYRPGETANFGMIVKPNLWWQDATAGQSLAKLPLKFTITDPGGNVVDDQVLHLNAAGFIDNQWQTKASSLSGQYTATIRVGTKEQGYDIAVKNFRVADFVPATLKLNLDFNKQAQNGWVSPQDLKANIQLDNLYGLPAVANSVQAEMTLNPGSIYLQQYPDYSFTDPLANKNADLKTIDAKLPEQKTDAKGQTVFNLDLAEYANATYNLSFYVQAFKKDGGHAVEAIKTITISPLPYLVGVKTNGDLSALRQNIKRKVQFITVNPQGDKIALDNLKLTVFELQPISVLVRQDDGTYSYETKTKQKQLTQQDYQIKAGGSDFSLPTNTAGSYLVKLTNAQNNIIAKVNFAVMGPTSTTFNKISKLKVELDKKSYMPGDTMKLSINTPYAGSGLITIERNKVFTYKWFKTDSQFTTQTIKIPADFSGSGYIQVDFARSYDAKNTFMNPLSYAVVPFSINQDSRKLNLKLQAPEKYLPGKSVPVQYSSNQPAKIIVYAVDKGILQVANYQMPAPFGYFFAKQALQVDTLQNLDLVLPRFQEKMLSTTGGGEKAAVAKHLVNPFQKVTVKPVVFWSKLVDVDTKTKTIDIPVPDYFNGDLQIMAVAVNQTNTGAAKTDSFIQAHFIMSPNAPEFVTPGDEFEVAVNVTNTVKQSKPINISLVNNPYFSVVSAPAKDLQLAKGQSKTVFFKLKTGNKLGPATLQFIASNGTLSSKIKMDVSIRPASVFRTYFQNGYADKKITLATPYQFYPNYRKLTVSAGTDPRVLIPGLMKKLDQYQLQIIDLYDFSITNISTVTQDLQQWQQASGQFVIPGAERFIDPDVLTVFIMDVLTEAKSNQNIIPDSIFNNGMNYIKQLAYNANTTAATLDNQARAIFVVTRNGIVTTNAVDHLQSYLKRTNPKAWQQSTAGLYLAASYKLMQQDKIANAIVAKFARKPVINGQTLRILAQYFPDTAKQIVKSKDIMQFVNQITAAELQAPVASLLNSIMGIKAFGGLLDQQDTQQISLTADKQTLKQASAINEFSFPATAKEITLKQTGGNGFYYQLLMSGYPTTTPKTAVTKGLEVFYQIADKDKPITNVKLGQEVNVSIRVRDLNKDYGFMPIVITGLLPGGFTLVPNSLDSSQYFYDVVRADRIVLFLFATPDVRTITYKLRATTTGNFVMPPIYAQSLLDPNNIYAEGTARHITVK